MRINQAIAAYNQADSELNLAAIKFVHCKVKLANELTLQYKIGPEDSPWEMKINGDVVRAVFKLGTWELFVLKDPVTAFDGTSMA